MKCDLDNTPYSSRRSPVVACNGMVATSQPLAASAGLHVLQLGGNAVDAALATAISLTVLEPTSNGIGSDAFAIVWDGKQLHGLNASGRWPRSLSSEGLRGRGYTAVPERGWLSVSVPGAPSAWQALSKRFGRLSMVEVMTPAIEYAEKGFPLSPVIARLWADAAATFLSSTDPAVAGWRECFGGVPSAGTRWSSPGHAACLRTLMSRGIEDFYQGEVAERIVAYAARTGGALSMDDMAAHSCDWVDPISVTYRDHEVWELPPNGQGIAALMALGMLDGFDVAKLDHGSSDAWHLQIEAMKLAFADNYKYVADPAMADVPIDGLISSDYLNQRRSLIGERAQSPGPGLPPKGGTVYLCTADRDGMMVSLIQSNYMGFGSGVVVPDIGVSLHNRAAGFTLQAGHANEAKGGKRPRHTIIPAFLTRGGEPVGPFGVMGGEMQPQGHLQVVSSMLDHGLNPQSALDASRWQVREGLNVELEPGTDPALIDQLTRVGHKVSVAPHSRGFGRGQIICRTEDGVYIGGSEPRTDGAALGY